MRELTFSPITYRRCKCGSKIVVPVAFSMILFQAPEPPHHNEMSISWPMRCKNLVPLMVEK